MCDKFGNTLNSWSKPYTTSYPSYMDHNHSKYYTEATAVRDDLKNWDLLMYIKNQNLKHMLILNYSNDPLDNLASTFNPSFGTSYYNTTGASISSGGYTNYTHGFRGGKIPGTRKTPGRADGEVWE